MWKFQKARQVWLLRWMFRPDLLRKHDFKLMLQYIVALKGGARERTLRRAEDIVKAGSDGSTELLEKANKIANKRARKVVKVLIAKAPE